LRWHPTSGAIGLAAAIGYLDALGLTRSPRTSATSRARGGRAGGGRTSASSARRATGRRRIVPRRRSTRDVGTLDRHDAVRAGTTRSAHSGWLAAAARASFALQHPGTGAVRAHAVEMFA
jgi:hypothetical protein